MQNLIERNLDPMLGIRLLRSEYATGRKHGGRVDTLGIDANSNPVIIEYKLSSNESGHQPRSHLHADWGVDHRAEFELLVMKQLGDKPADAIDWSAPRLLSIAGGFTRYDEHAVQQLTRRHRVGAIQSDSVKTSASCWSWLTPLKPIQRRRRTESRCRTRWRRLRVALLNLFQVASRPSPGSVARTLHTTKTLKEVRGFQSGGETISPASRCVPAPTR